MDHSAAHLVPYPNPPPGLTQGAASGPPHFGTFNRPARRQADEVDKWDTDATDYNIWYNRKCGDYRAKRIEGRESAAYRCQVMRDAGITKSDENSYLCVYFARGKCVRGPDCTFYHRIPEERDEAKLDLTYDVFGRERHRTDRDDMGGVGSFSRDNRTLYIGGVRRVKGVDLQELIVRNFIEWGELESVRVIYDKSIAFVRYKLRAAAEFAKEAMADQSLGYKEVLNVRWANEDPNPRARAEKESGLANQVYNAVMAAGGPSTYPDMSTLGTGDAYPTTDGQYVEAIPADYQQALQFAAPYVPSSVAPQQPQQSAYAGQQDESALALLSAYDADSYADRYGSGDDQHADASSSTELRSTSVEGSSESETSGQQHYTPEQWRQWYQYYYGYVPAELPLSSTPNPAPAAAPSSSTITATNTTNETGGTGAPAKKMRVK